MVKGMHKRFFSPLKWKHLQVGIFFAVALVLILQPAVYAMTPEQRRTYAERGILFIDDPCPTGTGDEATPASPSTLVGNDNIQKAYNYFVSKGLTPTQSAGIVGNLRQESRVDPRSNQPDGPGMGIAQWSEGGRWDALLTWAAEQTNQNGSTGRNPFDLGTQLDYIWHEMNHVPPWSQTLPAIKATTTVEEATQVFEDKFEKAGDPQMENRIKYAQEVLALYGTGGQGAIDTATGCGSGILVGDYAFPLAPQKKQNYGYTLPCNNPKTNGDYMNNGVYTDKYGTSTPVRTCHHDATPAFDLSYGTEATGNQPIYAIASGTIVGVETMYKPKYEWGQPCNIIHLRANMTEDKAFYWYGHILASVTQNQVVQAGEQIGTVAPHSYGPRCWEGGVHLHVHRGCFNPAFPRVSEEGPQKSGSDDCRDPGFITDLETIWGALPE